MHLTVSDVTSESALFSGDRRPVSVSGTSDRLMASMKPLLSSQLVTEFSCIYKFVVMDELQVVHVYFLDLKHGQHTFCLSSTDNVPCNCCEFLSMAVVPDVWGHVELKLNQQNSDVLGRVYNIHAGCWSWYNWLMRNFYQKFQFNNTDLNSKQTKL